jgi:hypothetical protein
MRTVTGSIIIVTDREGERRGAGPPGKRRLLSERLGSSMSRTTLCPGCGLQVPVPSDYTRPRLRCPECGAFCEVPAAPSPPRRQPPSEADPSPPRRQPPSEADPAGAARRPTPPPPTPHPRRPPPAAPPPSPDSPKTAPRDQLSPTPSADDLEDVFARFFAEEIQEQTASSTSAGTSALQAASSRPADAEPAASPQETGGKAATGMGAVASEHIRPAEDHQKLAVPPESQKLALLSEESYHVEPVAGEEVRCPGCGGGLPAGAVLCIHCGLDLRQGKQRTRTYTPIQRRWEPGLTLRQRLLLFTLMQVVGAPIFIWVAVRDQDVLGTAVAWVLYALLTSFLTGTYNHLDIERNTRGRVRLRRTWHFCFFPLSPRTIPWQQYEGVVTRTARRVGLEDWLVVIAFAFLGLIPGLLWWYYAIEKDRYLVALAQNHGFPEEILYFGPQMSVMEELADLITTATNLPRLYA